MMELDAFVISNFSIFRLCKAGDSLPPHQCRAATISPHASPLQQRMKHLPLREVKRSSKSLEKPQLRHHATRTAWSTPAVVHPRWYYNQRFTDQVDSSTEPVIVQALARSPTGPFAAQMPFLESCGFSSFVTFPLSNLDSVPLSDFFTTPSVAARSYATRCAFANLSPTHALLQS